MIKRQSKTRDIIIEIKLITIGTTDITPINSRKITKINKNKEKNKDKIFIINKIFIFESSFIS